MNEDPVLHDLLSDLLPARAVQLQERGWGQGHWEVSSGLDDGVSSLLLRAPVHTQLRSLRSRVQTPRSFFGIGRAQNSVGQITVFLALLC